MLSLRKVKSLVINIVNSSRNPMPRFYRYIEYMAKLNGDMSLYDVARTIIEKG